MKANYSNGNRTIPEAFDSEFYVKCADRIGKYEKGIANVVGYFKNNKGKYGTSYSLAIQWGEEALYLNIPTWLGSKIDDDFTLSGVTIEEFMTDVSIKEISEVETRNGKTYNVCFYC